VEFHFVTLRFPALVVYVGPPQRSVEATVKPTIFLII